MAAVRRDPATDRTGREHRFRAATLFTDISGFTPIAEAFSRAGPRGAEELSELLNDYFSVMTHIADSFGGIVAKFGGDSMMVVFPAGRDDRRARRRAVQCALDMQVAAAGHRSVPTSIGRFDLTFKAGVSFGHVMTTVVGDPKVRLEYVVAGDPIDRCAQAEHTAAPGTLVADPFVVDRCPGLVGEAATGSLVRVTGLEPRERHAPRRSERALSSAESRALESFLHPAIADRIRSGHTRFVNEHRRVAIIFVGFGGFDYTAHGVGKRLQTFVIELVHAIARLDGHLLQLEMGDKGSKALVLFGAPVAHEDDADRAVALAIEVRDLVEPAPEIGVATGTVFCGEVGGPARREYMALGDTVNVAARLMQSAAPGQILLSHTGSRELLRHVELRQLPAITVKGKRDRVSVAEVRARTEAVGSDLEPDADALPLVAREDELRRIRLLLAAGAEGHGSVLAISGEPGIGKSRIAGETLRLARAMGYDTAVGACQPHAVASPYYPWRSLLRSLFHLGPTRGIEEQREDLVRELTRLDPALAPRAPLLGPALNLPIPDTSATSDLEPALRAELLAALVANCLDRYAQESPLALVVEDSHWIDPPSRGLVTSLAPGLSRLPVVIILVLRTPTGDDEAAWAGRLPKATEIRLEPLSEPDLRRLAAAKVERSFDLEGSPPSTVLEYLVSRAEGNPFFLEELVNYLHDRGVDLTDRLALAAVEMPDSLSTLVLARIDQLPVVEQTALKVASVVGRRFPASWLRATYPPLGSARRVDAALDRLRRLEFTEIARRGPDPEFLFRHAVLREAAYDTLSVALRRDLHEAVGRHIESSFALELDQHVDELAYHFGETTNVEKQRVYFRKAADAARATSANETAIELLERLLPLTDGAGASDVLRALGEVRQLVGDWPGAEAAFRQGLVLAEEASVPLERARDLAALGYLLSYTTSPAETDALLVEALETFEKLRDDDGLKRTLEYQAFAAWQRSDHEAALQASRRLLELAERTGDRIAFCMATEQIGLVHWHRGDRAEAQTAFERALETASAIDHPRGVIHASNDLAGLFAEQGDHVRAFECVRTGLDAAREIGYRHAVAVMVGNTGELYRMHGQDEMAIACAAAGLTVTMELRDWADVISKVGNIALALAERGDTRTAEQFFDDAIALARSTSNAYFLCEYLHHRAELLYGLARVDQARSANDEARSVAAEVGRPDVQLPAELLDVRIRSDLGELDRQGARRSLQRLAATSGEPADRAAVDWTLWRVTGDEQARRRAGARYRRLAERAPNRTYLHRLEDLTGEPIIQPAPLPSVLTEAESVDHDLLELESRVRQLLEEADSTSTS